MNPLPVLAAGVLAMISAFFGVVMARVFWAEDLKHVEQLRASWARQEGFMQDSIESLQRTIEAKDKTIAIKNQTISVLKGETK